MKKSTLIKELKSKKELVGYIKYSEDCGGYYPMVKSKFLKEVLKKDDNFIFDHISSTSLTIFIY